MKSYFAIYLIKSPLEKLIIYAWDYPRESSTQSFHLMGIVPGQELRVLILVQV